MDSVEADIVMTNIGERIRQRSENVASKAEERRAKKDVNISSTETIDFFYQSFSSMKENTKKKLEEVDIIKKSEFSAYFDGIHKDLQAMQHYLNESSLFLPSFQIKKAQEAINSLNDNLETYTREKQPKKKFGFQAKGKKDNSKVVAEIKPPDATSSSSSILSKMMDMKQLNFFGFKDLDDCELMKVESELQNRQFSLENLRNCKVLALGNPSSLQFSKLQNCTVIVGPTSRSALIKDCTQCRFIMACQQVRIHNTEETSFYLHVTGAAIIENCKNVYFAPYNLEYPDLHRHYEESELNTDINNWSKIDDFHWLNENEVSPNFSLLQPEQMEKNWL